MVGALTGEGLPVVEKLHLPFVGLGFQLDGFPAYRSEGTTAHALIHTGGARDHAHIHPLFEAPHHLQLWYLLNWLGPWTTQNNTNAAGHLPRVARLYRGDGVRDGIQRLDIDDSYAAKFELTMDGRKWSFSRLFSVGETRRFF